MKLLRDVLIEDFGGILTGSQLFGVATDKSDYDIIMTRTHDLMDFFRDNKIYLKSTTEGGDYDESEWGPKCAGIYEINNPFYEPKINIMLYKGSQDISVFHTIHSIIQCTHTREQLADKDIRVKVYRKVRSQHIEGCVVKTPKPTILVDELDWLI